MEGHKVEGECRPSSDTPTHLAIYRAFGNVGGVVHTHSIEAVAWAQAGREIPCYGTTHADQFHGPVPITRALTEDEVKSAYELNTGKVIDGHYMGFDPRLDAYSAAGIRTDHECSHPEEMHNRIRRGMYVLMRQGTACHDLLNLLKGMNDRNTDR